jgi:hypothetical protein
MSRRTLPLAVLALAFPVVAPAEETYRHGRIRHAEAGVSIQRATEPGAEEAVPNMPFLPGDRVWSDAGGRAEFQFADGTLLRLDHGSKLDYIAHDEGGDDERVVLRLWSGALVLHPRDGRNSPEFAVETPGGVMVAEERGVYRVDVDAGETRVSVYEGEAVLEAERRIRVRAGERAYARAGEAYGDPERFDRAEGDDFARWDADRQGQVGLARQAPEYLPEDVSPYADELDGHGSWYYEAEVGHVWRPYVDATWRPYHNGRWMWTSYGWTWLPYETWGWAPFHYGRWGHAPALGWYWIPGRSWGPAWVNWAVGTDYVGWCPMGWRDRHVPGRSRDRGWAIPRGGAGGNAWVYARRGDLSARDLPRRVAMDVAVPRNMTIIEPSRSRVTRDLRVVDAVRATAAAEGRSRAVPRNVRTNPTPGDTTPELRSDPATTIPFPTARRRYESDRERTAERDNARGHHPLPRNDAAAAPPSEDAAVAQRAVPRTAAPEISRPFPWTARPRAARPEGDEGRAARPRDGEHAGAHSPEADRDVMRPVFRPLSRPRPDGERRGGSSGDSGARTDDASRTDTGARPRGGDRGWDRSAPPAERPQPQAERPAPRPERAAPRPERSEPRAEGRGEGRRGGHSGGASAAPPPRSSGGGGERAVPRNRRERQ